jgi:hypothetical protein
LAAALRMRAGFVELARGAGFACGTGAPSSGAEPCFARIASPSALELIRKLVILSLRAVVDAAPERDRAQASRVVGGDR